MISKNIAPNKTMWSRIGERIAITVSLDFLGASISARQVFCLRNLLLLN
jgi:hypothetical protein